MTKQIKFIKEFEITIPDDKIDETLKDFKEVIQPDAEVIDLFKQVAYNIGQGFSSVEGVMFFDYEELDSYSEEF